MRSTKPFQFRILASLGVTNPPPMLEIHAQWLIEYLRDGINDPNSKPQARLKKYLYFDGLLRKQKITKVRSRDGKLTPKRREGIVEYVTGRPAIIADFCMKVRGPATYSPLQAWVKFNPNSWDFIRMVDCLEFEGAPVIPTPQPTKSK